MIEMSTRDMLRAVADTQVAGSAWGPHPGKPLPLNEYATAVAAQAVQPAMSPIVLAGVVRLSEFALVAITGLAAYGIYLFGALGFSGLYLTAIFGIAAATVIALQAADAYNVNAFRAAASQLGRVAGAWVVVFGFATSVSFFFKLDQSFSRVWFAMFFVTGLVVLSVFRMILRSVVLRWTRAGRLERRAVIVGGGPAAERLIAALHAQKDGDVRIYGVFDDRADDRSPSEVAGLRKLGPVDHLVEFARRTRVDLVLVSLPVTAETRVLTMLRKLWVLPVDIRLSAHTAKLRFRPRAYSYIGNVPVLDIFDKPLADWDVVMKWVFDKVVGTLALIALSPVMLATAIAVKLDSKGPVLFRQKRFGFNNELIEVFKFRSMYTDMSDAGAAKLVTKDDPRVTRVGRFIRKTSLDELPQLFNVVFKGNLSLVGPRPHAVQAKAAEKLYDDVVDGYFARHRVKPGITGWAQVNGWRGETDTPEKIQRRVEHDLYYIENWSVMFDITILAMTPVSLLSKRENAY